MRNSEKVIADVSVVLTAVMANGTDEGMRYQQGGATVTLRHGVAYNTIVVAVDCDSATFTSSATSPVSDGNNGIKKAAEHLLANIICVVEYLAKEEK